MPNKVFRFHCEVCNWTKVSRTIESAGLVEHKQAQVPGGIKKMVTPKDVTAPKPRERTKRFKCPGCGRLVAAVESDDVQAIRDQRAKEETRRKEIEEQDAAAALVRAVEQRQMRRIADAQEANLVGREGSTQGREVQGFPPP